MMVEAEYLKENQKTRMEVLRHFMERASLHVRMAATTRAKS